MRSPDQHRDFRMVAPRRHLTAVEYGRATQFLTVKQRAQGEPRSGRQWLDWAGSRATAWLLGQRDELELCVLRRSVRDLRPAQVLRDNATPVLSRDTSNRSSPDPGEHDDSSGADVLVLARQRGAALPSVSRLKRADDRSAFGIKSRRDCTHRQRRQRHASLWPVLAPCKMAYPESRVFAWDRIRVVTMSPVRNRSHTVCPRRQREYFPALNRGAECRARAHKQSRGRASRS